MLWEAGILLTGIFLAEYYLIGRSVDKAVDRLMKRPTFQALKKMDDDPNMSKLVCDSVESIVAINKFVREDLPYIKPMLRTMAQGQKALIASKPKTKE